MDKPAIVCQSQLVSSHDTVVCAEVPPGVLRGVSVDRQTVSVRDRQPVAASGSQSSTCPGTVVTHTGHSRLSCYAVSLKRHWVSYGAARSIDRPCLRCWMHNLPAQCSQPEPGSSTLKVLKYKYEYFPLPKYLSTNTFNFGQMYLSAFQVLSKCTQVQSAVHFNYRAIFLPR